MTPVTWIWFCSSVLPYARTSVRLTDRLSGKHKKSSKWPKNEVFGVLAKISIHMYFFYLNVKVLMVF